MNHHQIRKLFALNLPNEPLAVFFISYPLSGSKALEAEGATGFHVTSGPLQPTGSGPVLYHHLPGNVR